jgi:iron complex transport system substrate-binding protein
MLQRIVSFLPSATEMAFELGLGDSVLAVSHECDYPAAAKSKPVVVRPVLPVERMAQAEIDREVTQRLRDGQSLYELDAAAIRDLSPDLILTQDLCQVCAASGNDATQLIASLPKTPRVLSMTPKSLEDIFSNLLELGEVTGTAVRARQLIKSARARLEGIAARTRGAARRVRVFCMEWLDPPYCCGHWVAEMIDFAGGTDELARRGTDSVRIAWEQVLRFAPEVLVVMPCGYGLAKAATLAEGLRTLTGWNELPAVRNGRVYVVDANSYFARPGLRLVEGTLLLAHLLHPQLIAWDGPPGAFQRLKNG